MQERFYFGDTVLPLFESGIPLVRERMRALPDADNITIAYPDEGAWKRFHYQFGDYPEVNPFLHSFWVLALCGTTKGFLLSTCSNTSSLACACVNQVTDAAVSPDRTIQKVGLDVVSAVNLMWLLLCLLSDMLLVLHALQHSTCHTVVQLCSP